jgi:hypothetical protein
VCTANAEHRLVRPPGGSAERCAAARDGLPVFVKVSFLGNRLALNTSDIGNICEPAFLD